MRAPRYSSAHQGRLAAAAAVALVVSGFVAFLDPVPGWERDATRWINGAPTWSARVLYPVMQLGTIAAPLAAAVLVLWLKRDAVLALAMVVGGLAAWFGAKAIKAVVERGRPLEYVPGLVVREGDGTGLGFVSGHSAVAAVTATLLVPALPRRWRPVPVVLAAAVGIARIVHGVHLPADVVGGWAFGVLIGLGLLEVVDRLPGRHRKVATT